MTPLVPFTPRPPTAQKIAELRQWASDNGMNPDDVTKGIDADLRGEWFGNELYVVIRQDIDTPDGWPDMVWLSVRRQDRGPVRDWRHMQAIKTQLVGAECEGVELYPAESRVVDTANQFHIWAFNEPGPKFPFGFGEGKRTDDSAGGTVQRKGAGR
jgi:hypothetical protein